MRRRGHDLPSLTALLAFEAAARHLSFKQAATELNVTPGAVSRQIKALEGEIGAPLFMRLHRAVRLTDDGAQLYATLSRAFDDIAETMAGLTTRTRDRTVTLGTTAAFAFYWLLPRLGAFGRAHPEITINQVVSDKAADLRGPGIDLAVRYCDGPTADEAGEVLFAERITPVATPDLLRRLGGRKGLAALLTLPLIDLTDVEESWLDWQSWLRLAKRDDVLPKRRMLTSYVVAVAAALDGQGVVLGWERLLAPLLQSGRLSRAGGISLPAPGRYYAIWPARGSLRPEARLVLDWMLTEARKAD